MPDMPNSGPDTITDEWFDWLMHRRHGGDSNAENFIQAQTAYYADRVLSGARLGPHGTLLDVGTGDGLVAFKAIEQVGPSLNVILTDISPALIRHVERTATERGVRGQCKFFECSAEKLAGIDDEQVDAVVTRAVLAYVPDKSAAMREFFRVLKPGGRVSMCEPIMRDDALATYALKKMIDAQSPEFRDRFLELQCRIRSAQFPNTIEKISESPLTNFTERDLFRLAQDAGFVDVHMEFHIDSYSTSQTSWNAFLESSPHPLAPPVKQILDEHFSKQDIEFFTEKFMPIIVAGQSAGTSRNAYLTAAKK